MGNFASCATPGQKAKNNEAVAATKVVLPSGEVQNFYYPTRAAEVMLEVPNYFLVNIQSLQVGTRLTALGADDDLQMGNVYTLFPMKRLNSVVSADDVAAVFWVDDSCAKKGSSIRIVPEWVGVGKISAATPAVADDECGEKVGGGKMDLGDVDGMIFPEIRYWCRSKKPVLDTIFE